MRQGGPADWLTAVGRAGLIGTYSRTYGLGIYEPAATVLLALLLYTTGAAAGGADAVDVDTVLEHLGDVDESRRGRDALGHLHTRLVTGLRQAGHDPDAQLAQGESDAMYRCPSRGRCSRGR